MNLNKRSSQSSLTPSDVLDIRRLVSEGNTQTSTASRFNITRKAVYDIINGNSWSDIPNPVTLRGYSNYQIYPDGRVFSNNSGNFMKRKSTSSVRLRDNKGTQKTVAINDLMRKAFK
jgi:hypothetical protein